MKKDSKSQKNTEDPDYYVKLTYPYNRPGPGDKRNPAKDLSKTKEFNYAYPSVTDFQDIKWKLIDCCAVSNEGNVGVIFIHSKDGNFVLKGSADPAVELFGNYLFQELKIPTPKIEVVTHDDPRFKLAIQNLDRATYFDHNIKHRVRSRLDRPFLLLMEYIPGLRIHDLGVPRTKECFDTAYPDGRDRLISMGIVLITDVFINNMDRYPLIWKNNGNSDNLVVKFDTNFNSRNEELFDKQNFDLKMVGICAVDNKPCLFGKETRFAEDNYIKYLNTVEELVQSIFFQLALVRDGKMNPFDNYSKRLEYANIISTFIYNNTGHDIKSLGELQILLGMALGMQNIVTVGYDIIANLKNKVKSTVTNDWKGFWAENCQSLKLDLLKDLLQLFEKYSSKCLEIIGWADTITLHQYLLKSEKNQGTGENDSSVLSVHDEDEPVEKPPEKSDIELKYETLLDKKVYEFFGIDAKEEAQIRASQQFSNQQSKIPSRNSVDNLSQRGSQQNIDSNNRSPNKSPERLHDFQPEPQPIPQEVPQEIPKEEPKEIPQEEPAGKKGKNDKSKSPDKKDEKPEKKKRKWF